MQKTWFVVPARGGSKGIPKKNVRILGDYPLITWVLKTLSKTTEKDSIIVSTDDDEIASVSREYAIIHSRGAKLSSDEVTLDEVIFDIAEWLINEKGAQEEDIIITVQPTSPFLSQKTLLKSANRLAQENIDSIISVKDDRHLRWGKTEDGEAFPKFDERLNRQWLPADFVETGGVIGCKVNHIIEHGTRIGENVELIEVGDREGLDIDSYADWALAEYWAQKLKIIIRLDGSNSLGFGHLYRGLAIAECLTLHEVIFLTRKNGEYSLGAEFLNRHHYPVETVDSADEALSYIKKEQPEIIINDILDTEEDYVSQLNQEEAFVVNFEDLGSGNKHADVVINDLYPDLFPKKNHWYGVEYSILNPQFEYYPSKNDVNRKVRTILIAFGGTDPNNFTLKALEAIDSLKFTGKIKVVLGPGYSHKTELDKYLNDNKLKNLEIFQDVNNMADLMGKSDLALTSAGRTVTELMVIGVPTITLCQNVREMRHNHATSAYGVVNLGLGESVDSDALADHIDLFLDDYSLRKDMFMRMKRTVSDRSNHKIVNKILEAYKKEQSN